MIYNDDYINLFNRVNKVYIDSLKSGLSDKWAANFAGREIMKITREEFQKIIDGLNKMKEW